jgi:hypothetical protein
MKKLYSSLNAFSILLLLSLTIFQGCIKDKIDLNKSGNNSISPQFAGALVYSSLTIKDILAQTNKNGQLTTDSTGFITLVYKGNLFSLKAADVLTIPAQPPVTANTTLSATDAAALNLLPQTQTLTFSDSSLIIFQTTDATQKIDKLNCKTATLALNLNYTIKDDAKIIVTIPGAKNSLGAVFTQTIQVHYTGSPVTVNNSYLLDGYTIDMTNGNTTHNTIKILYNVIVTKTTNSISSAGDGASFTETFSNVNYNSIIGYLGQHFLSPNTDTVPITIFKNNIFTNGATFNIVNPLIKVFLTNSYGLPINAHFNTFEGYSPSTASTPSTTYTITGAPNPIPIPTVAVLGQTAVDSFKLDNSNSNIITLINNFPKNVIYNVSAQSNPAGPVYNNFITDTSQFKIDLELDLPLYGSVKNFTFQDTVPYSFPDSTQLKYIKSVTVRAYIDNGFPIDVGMRIAFVDTFYNVIDELINPTYQLIMPSASVGANNMVTAPTSGTHDFIIPSSIIPKLSKVKHILIGAVANTYHVGSGANVKIYDFYHLDVKIGVNVQFYLKF